MAKWHFHLVVYFDEVVRAQGKQFQRAKFNTYQFSGWDSLSKHSLWFTDKAIFLSAKARKFYILDTLLWTKNATFKVSSELSTGSEDLFQIQTKTKTSVQFSCSVVSDSLQPHELQHARPPCPPPIPGIHSDSHPSSQWCHPAISSLVVSFPPAPNPSQHQSLFQWVNSSQEVAKVTGVSVLASFLPKKS